MSLSSYINGQTKEVLRRMIGGNALERALNIKNPVMSTEMENAINLWTRMYKNDAPWLHEPDANNVARIASLGLPAMIASEKARMVVLEMKSEITTPTVEVEQANPDYKEPEPDMFGNVLPATQPPTITVDKPTSNTERAEYMNKQYEKLKKNLRRQLEYGIAKGGLVIKPYVVINKSKGNDGEEVEATEIEFDYIQADNFYPLAFDASGRITEAAFIQTKAEKDVFYRRLEYHKLEGNSVKVINKAYKSNTNTNKPTLDINDDSLGKEIPLTDVPEWASLQPETTINYVDKPLFAYFKMPEANTIDLNSPLGVSGYSRAKDLIKDADMQYSRLLWEYEAGEMAIDIDRDALIETDRNGQKKTERPMMQQRLFRTIDLGESNTYQPYSPALRDASFSTGLNTILMRIEDVCAISRGTLSDAGSEARTATELKILKQRSYSANMEIQHALEDALRDVIYVMNIYCTLYQITPEGEYDVSFEWDDSILVDVDTELGKRITLMQNGLASKLETRMWYFGETERQAQEALQHVDEESAQAMEDNLIQQQNMANIGARAKAAEQE